MSKLLSANFNRLKKNAFFRISVLFMLANGVLRPIADYMIMQKYEDYIIPLDSDFFVYPIFVVVLSAVFCSLFVGTEYSDGTMRNKLMVGHSRVDIYLSNLMVGIAASFFMCLAYILPFLCVGTPLLGFFSNFPAVLRYIGCIFILFLAFAAICTSVSMLCQSKAHSAVICILGVFILLLVGTYISSRLSSPEYIEGYQLDQESGQLVPAPPEPNPGYLRGTKREIYEFLHDFLPGDQAVQFASREAMHLGLMALYSILITIGTTGFGIYFFFDEDIK